MNFIPALFGALIILVAGWYIAKLAGRIVERVLVTLKLEKVADSSRINDYLPQTRQGIRPTLSSMIGIARYGIFGFAMIAAISQLGIAVQLLNILFTGLVAFLALSFGLAFGLGGQSVAADITRSWFDRSRSAMGPGSVSERTTDTQDVETPMHH